MHLAPLVSRTLSLLLVLSLVAMAVFAIGPRTGAYRTVSILSGSMEPTFSAGDAIISVPIATSALRPGDVITYHAPVEGRPLVTHRILDVRQQGGDTVVRTRGDANVSPDPWDARLQGETAWRQVAVVPWAGTAIAALRADRVRTALLHGAPAVLAGLLLASIWVPRRSRDGDDEEDAGTEHAWA